MRALAGLALGLALAACGASEVAPAPGAATPAAAGPSAVATFAGGCFWCMEPPFDALDGVLSTTSGYTGGEIANPSYEQVSSGTTGHREAVRVVYDPTRIGYDALLEVFWRNVDPLDAAGQFCDKGPQYRSAVFVHDVEQRSLAEASKRRLESERRFASPIATEILDAGPFHPAEEYHQDYYRKNPLRYQYYRRGCGRDRRLTELWGSAAAH